MKQRQTLHVTTLISLICALNGAPALAQQAGEDRTTRVADASSEPNAAADDEATRKPFIADGRATRSWLALQSSGRHASKHLQTMSGPAMKRTYDRYLESFTRSVPDYWNSKKYD